MIKLWIKHWALETAFNMLTRKLKSPEDVNLFECEHLCQKWSAVLQSQIGGPLEPHVEHILSQCLEQQIKLNKGLIPCTGTPYELVQQYALPLLRRTFGGISSTAVEKLREYNHDESKTRMRTVERYEIIPRETKADKKLRGEQLARAQEMEDLGYSIDEIKEVLGSNRSRHQIIADRAMEGVEYQLQSYLERSILNGTFVAGAIFDTNVVSNKHFDCYIG